MDADQVREAIRTCILVLEVVVLLSLPLIVFVCGAMMARRGRAQITRAWTIHGRPARCLGICFMIISVASLVCYGVGGYVLFSGSTLLDPVLRWLPHEVRY